MKFSQNMLSKYCNFANKYGIKADGINELVTDPGNKNKYVFYYKNLQLQISLRFKLVSFHNILKFKQSNWLKKYVDFNTDKRKNAANRFKKDFFKLMNNSTFGKTMENLSKGINFRSVNNGKDYIRYTSKPSFVSQILNKSFVTIHELNQF